MCDPIKIIMSHKAIEILKSRMTLKERKEFVRDLKNFKGYFDDWDIDGWSIGLFLWEFTPFEVFYKYDGYINKLSHKEREVKINLSELQAPPVKKTVDNKIKSKRKK